MMKDPLIRPQSWSLEDWDRVKPIIQSVLDAKDAEIARLKTCIESLARISEQMVVRAANAGGWVEIPSGLLARANERIAELEMEYVFRIDLEQLSKGYNQVCHQLTKAEAVLMEVQDWANGTGNDAAEIRAILRRTIGAYFDAKNGEKADAAE